MMLGRIQGGLHGYVKMLAGLPDSGKPRAERLQWARSGKFVSSQGGPVADESFCFNHPDDLDTGIARLGTAERREWEKFKKRYDDLRKAETTFSSISICFLGGHDYDLKRWCRDTALIEKEILYYKFQSFLAGRQRLAQRAMADAAKFGLDHEALFFNPFYRAACVFRNLFVGMIWDTVHVWGQFHHEIDKEE